MISVKMHVKKFYPVSAELHEEYNYVLTLHLGNNENYSSQSTHPKLNHLNLDTFIPISISDHKCGKQIQIALYFIQSSINSDSQMQKLANVYTDFQSMENEELIQLRCNNGAELYGQLEVKFLEEQPKKSSVKGKSNSNDKIDRQKVELIQPSTRRNSYAKNHQRSQLNFNRESPQLRQNQVRGGQVKEYQRRQYQKNTNYPLQNLEEKKTNLEAKVQELQKHILLLESRYQSIETQLKLQMRHFEESQTLSPNQWYQNNQLYGFADKMFLAESQVTTPKIRRSNRHLAPLETFNHNDGQNEVNNNLDKTMIATYQIETQFPSSFLPVEQKANIQNFGLFSVLSQKINGSLRKMSKSSGFSLKIQAQHKNLTLCNWKGITIKEDNKGTTVTNQGRAGRLNQSLDQSMGSSMKRYSLTKIVQEPVFQNPKEAKQRNQRAELGLTLTHEAVEDTSPIKKRMKLILKVNERILIEKRKLQKEISVLNSQLNHKDQEIIAVNQNYTEYQDKIQVEKALRADMESKVSKIQSQSEAYLKENNLLKGKLRQATKLMRFYKIGMTIPEEDSSFTSEPQIFAPNSLKKDLPHGKTLTTERSLSPSSKNRFFNKRHSLAH